MFIYVYMLIKYFALYVYRKERNIANTYNRNIYSYRIHSRDTTELLISQNLSPTSNGGVRYNPRKLINSLSIESSTRFLTHDSNRGFVLRELYNKCTRDTDRWTAICEDYQKRIDDKKTTLSVIRQSFQIISNVPSKTLDDALIKKTTERRFNGRSQHIRYNASKNTYVRINHVLIDTCHCEQYMSDSM